MVWFVYMIECGDKKLYTGISNDVRRRIQEHAGGYGCRFTRVRTPVKLVHKEEFNSKIAAMRREREIKGFSRKKKLALVRSCPSA